ncbi:MAG: DUF6036 family nucleotidyltransferase [Proteobacteria bacterium]|nr:DUF6036 family nucleotidyltransferase [Pseudomonadota bacterium]
MAGLNKKKIENLFKLLNQELNRSDIQGEVYLVGGAVMCLVFDARQSTQDIDAYFKPSNKIREAAARVGIKANVDPKWLNDGVKGFLSNTGTFAPFLELSNLKIFTAQADYLLAMKCLAMRIGEEFYDLDDIRYLLRYLNIDSYDEAVETISSYYPLDKFPQKTLYALQELLNT